jgi:Family of unknown function (DUF695)
MTEEEFELVDTWSVVESEDQGNPLIIRLRQEIDCLVGQKLYPHLLMVTWKFPNPMDSGLPKPNEAQEASEFENLLVNGVESSSCALLTCIATSNGHRAWYFYTNNVDVFSDHLHNIPQKDDRYPITVYLTSNDRWKSFEDIKAIYE